MGGLLHLLIFLVYIHGSQSCPLSVHFHCPKNDNYKKEPVLAVLPFPFTYDPPVHDEYCEQTCEDGHQPMINCTGIPVLPDQVLSILPSNHTIVIQFLDSPHVDELKNDPCKVYEVVVAEFPFSPLLVNFTFLGEHDTYVGCPSDFEEEKYLNWGGTTFASQLCDDHSFYYGPYAPGHIPEIPIPPRCIQFQMLSDDNKFSVQYNMSTDHDCQICVAGEDGGCYDVCHGSNQRAPSPAHLSAPTQGSSISAHKILMIILCSVLPVSAVVLILLLAIYWRQRKNKPGLKASSSRITFLNRTRSYPEAGNINGVTVFSYTELQEATNNFDPTKELGEGGFGTVYHGKLRDGREVAVKRMYENNYTQVEQFKNEIRILTSLQHPNLATLYGCTSRHSRQLLLVYEYIPNKTVADHLHGDKANSALLLWPTRMSIAIQTATALSYLHLNEVVHRDVKTNNILLDHNFRAKVADFGLSRLFPADVSHVSTAPQGTPGYVDPEYHQCYHLTDRSDVYSFGVVLVELVSSLPAIDLGRHRHEVNLANYAMNRIQCSGFGELVDAKLGFETDFKVKRMTTLVAELAFRCLQEERELRPSMEEVLEELKRLESVDYNELEAAEIGYENHYTT